MTQSNDWLLVCADHLDEAERCFQKERYAYALFWLQQANETLAKGLLEVLRLVETGRPENSILRKLGLDLDLPTPKRLGHLYGEHFFTAIGKTLKGFESSLSAVLDSPELQILREKSPDILKGYEQQFKDWPKRIELARTAYRSTSHESDLGQTIRSYDKVLVLIANSLNMEIELPDFNFEELAGSTLLVEAVEDSARKEGIELVPSLRIVYVKIILLVMDFFVVLSLGRNLAHYEASVRYPEGHFQDYSQNIVVKNFNEIIALHRKGLAIAQAGSQELRDPSLLPK